MKNYNLFLIRNGLTLANKNAQYCGCKNDQPLCEEGRSELFKLLENGVYPYADVVYTSPMLRARETADILYPETQPVELESLREADFGRFDGKSMYELCGDADYERWAAPSSQFTPEGVEPPQEVFQRSVLSIFSIIEDAMRAGEHNIAVVTHASIIGNVMSALCLPHRPPYDWGCDAGCGYKISTDVALWQRGHIFEPVCALPLPFEEQEQSFDTNEDED